MPPIHLDDSALTVPSWLSRACGLYESEREGALREGVLRKLTAILQEYAVHEGLASMDEAEAARRLVQLRTFGSYRLGAHSPDADIDAYAAAPYAEGRTGRQRLTMRTGGPDRLCLAPCHCTRTSFFQKAPILLEASPDIADVRVISDAYAPTVRVNGMRWVSADAVVRCWRATNRFVPVIKMTIDGIHVDLLFAALALDSIPDALEILDDSILRDLDEQSVRRR
jgi:poly(A) polymerase